MEGFSIYIGTASTLYSRRAKLIIIMVIIMVMIMVIINININPLGFLFMYLGEGAFYINFKLTAPEFLTFAYTSACIPYIYVSY